MKGFTLIELLVVVGIFTLIIGVSFTLLSTSRLSVDIGEAQIQAAENARIAIDRISRELRLSRASKVRIANSITAAFPGSETTPGSVINFQIPVGCYADALNLDSGRVRWGTENTEGGFIYYALGGPNGNQLFRGSVTDTGIDTPAAITSNISAITFDRPSSISELITITVVGQSQVASGVVINQTLGSIIKLRN